MDLRIIGLVIGIVVIGTLITVYAMGVQVLLWHNIYSASNVRCLKEQRHLSTEKVGIWPTDISFPHVPQGCESNPYCHSDLALLRCG